MHKINVSDIQIFLAVAEHKSFTRAANQFFLSQPAVSKSIRHLELELDLPLFERSRRHVMLTEYGEYLYEHWRPAFDSITSTIEKVQEMRDTNKHQIHVGVLYGFDFVSILTEVFAAFESVNSNIRINFNIYNLKELNDRMDSLDFLFTTNYDLEHHKDYEQLLLNPVPMFVAISKKNPLSEKKHLKLADIKDETFITLSDAYTSTGIPRIRSILGSTKSDPQILTVDNIPSQFLKIRRNDGISLTNAYACRGFEENICLREVLDYNPNLYCVCAWNPEHMEPPAKKFLSYLKQEFKQK
ncbi:MAG: LysR family transcriptional regulator [Lachnospiraceae bacterium]